MSKIRKILFEFFNISVIGTDTEKIRSEKVKNNAKNSPFRSCFSRTILKIKELFSRFHSRETFAAIYGAVVAGLERNSCFFSAFRANCGMHFSLRTGVFTGVSASFASLRLVLETFFSVKFLFTCRENKFFSTVFANKGLVFVHAFTSLKYKILFFAAKTDSHRHL